MVEKIRTSPVMNQTILAALNKALKFADEEEARERKQEKMQGTMQGTMMPQPPPSGARW